jgi:soluble P-type ATPase
MAQNDVFLRNAYSTHMKMFVNTEQTGIHLDPTSGAQTWTKRGSKHVLVHEIKDERQVIISVSSSANDNLLLFQVVFTGTTNKILPPRNTGRLHCEEVG